jgi:hypothetical protein
VLPIAHVADKPIFDLGPIHDGSGPDLGPDIGSTAGPESPDRRDLQRARRGSRDKKDKRTGLFIAAGLVGIALGVLLVVPLITDDRPLARDEPIDAISPVAPTPSRDAAEPPPIVIERAPGFEPPSAEHLRADEIASLFETDINSNGSRYGIAYVSTDDFVVLDHRGITLPGLEIAVEFETVSNLALLTNDGRTWAVNPIDRERNYLVSNSYVVVVSERPGTIAIIRPDDQSAISLMSSALPVPSVQLPEGAGLLWAQGRGPLVMPRTGGTFELSGIASSLTRISDARAVAASLHGTVYESCDDSLACTYLSQVDEGPLTLLPFEAGTAFTVSPDGNWVVAAVDDVIIVHEIGTQRSAVTLEGDVTAVDWAPDGSFVAIVSGDVLSVVYPDDGRVLPLRLNHVPDENSLLVFEG